MCSPLHEMPNSGRDLGPDFVWHSIEELLTKFDTAWSSRDQTVLAREVALRLEALHLMIGLDEAPATAAPAARGRGFGTTLTGSFCRFLSDL